MTAIEQIVTAMIDYEIDEQNTVGELLHAIRVGEKKPYEKPVLKHLNQLDQSDLADLADLIIIDDFTEVPE